MVFNLSINIMIESKIIFSLLSNDTILTMILRSKMKSFSSSPFSRSLFISPYSPPCRPPQQNKFWYKKQRHNKWIKKDPKWIHLEQPNRLRCKEKRQRRCLSWSSCFPPQTSWLMQYHQYYGGLLSLAPRVPLFHPHHAQEHTQSTNATNNRAFKDGCDITDFSKFGTRNPLIDDLHTGTWASTRNRILPWCQAWIWPHIHQYQYQFYIHCRQWQFAWRLPSTFHTVFEALHEHDQDLQPTHKQSISFHTFSWKTMEAKRDKHCSGVRSKNTPS